MKYQISDFEQPVRYEGREKNNYNLFHRNDSSRSPANRHILMSCVHASCHRSPRSRLCGRMNEKEQRKD